MSDRTTVYQARYVFTGDGEPVPQGLVVVRGDALDYVGRPDGRNVDAAFPHAAITPGFVNAHTHLELGGLAGKLGPPESFPDWLRQVVAFRRSQSAEQLLDAVATGIRQSLQAGVTLIGDIATAGLSLPLLSRSPLAALVFCELIGMMPHRARQSMRAAQQWLAAVRASPRCRPGLSPHAPYTVRAALLKRVGQLAHRRNLPVAIHWAESNEEIEFLSGKPGAMRDFLREMGAWDETREPEELGSIDVLRSVLGGVRTLLVHANYLDPSELVPNRSWSVAFCPRTHAYFGHADHPFPRMLQAGINVCVGTDSLASNPDLSVLEELRFLHRCGVLRDGAALLRMGTSAGARALGFEDCAGILSPGRWADLAVVALPDVAESDPYGLLFASDLPVEATMCRGRFVYRRRPYP
jgi:cytosine/adenosine deaminase-related metal-dependent hydrolase